MNKIVLSNRIEKIVRQRLGSNSAAKLWCNRWTFDNYIAHVSTKGMEPKVSFNNITLRVLIGPEEFYHNGTIQIEVTDDKNEYTILLENYTHTKGDVIVEDIEIGDIHYEYEYGFCIKSQVISKPSNKDGYWSWQSEKLSGTTAGTIINYGVAKGFGHYGPNLYTYDAYSSCKMI